MCEEPHGILSISSSQIVPGKTQQLQKPKQIPDTADSDKARKKTNNRRPNTATSQSTHAPTHTHSLKQRDTHVRTRMWEGIRYYETKLISIITNEQLQCLITAAAAVPNSISSITKRYRRRKQYQVATTAIRQTKTNNVGTVGWLLRRCS